MNPDTTPQEINEHYTQLCARLGDVQFKLSKLEHQRFQLVDEIRRLEQLAASTTPKSEEVPNEA